MAQNCNRCRSEENALQYTPRKLLVTTRGTAVAVVRRMTPHRFLAGLGALALLALSAKVARAQATDASESATVDGNAATNHRESISHSVPNSRGESQVQSAERKSRSHWYGGAILVVDSTALALGIAAVAKPDAAAPLAMGAGLAYLAGGPIVHARHGRTGTALGSLGLRVGIPIAAAGVGAGVGAAGESDCSGEWCGIGAIIGGIFGFGAGMLVASVVDIAGLAYERESNTSTLRVALSPRLDPKRGTTGVDLVGSW